MKEKKGSFWGQNLRDNPVERIGFLRNEPHFSAQTSKWLYMDYGDGNFENF